MPLFVAIQFSMLSLYSKDPQCSWEMSNPDTSNKNIHFVVVAVGGGQENHI